jgi:hypothetical protein
MSLCDCAKCLKHHDMSLFPLAHYAPETVTITGKTYERVGRHYCFWCGDFVFQCIDGLLKVHLDFDKALKKME